MATLPSFCEHLSRSDGRTPASLRVVGNALRNAGLMDVGGIGRGAIHVGPDDAAAMVMASLWTDSACASPRAVEMLRTLKHRPAPPAEWCPRFLFLCSEFSTFGDVVSALIEYSPLLRRETAGLDVELTVRRPVPVATLRVIDHLGRSRVVREWIVDAQRHQAGFYRPEAGQVFDRRHASTITGATLFALGDCIRRDAREDA